MNAPVLLALLSLASAQVPFSDSKPLFGLATSPPPPTSHFDVELATMLGLLEEDRHAPKSVPLRFGFSLPHNVSLEAGSWYGNGTETVWRSAIKAPGAKALSVHFARFRLAPGMVMHVYSADRKHVLGGFTEENNKPNGRFATQPVRGDSIIVELKVPDSAAKFDFAFEKVVFAYRDIVVNDFDGSGACNVDVACPEAAGWDKEIRSAALIITDGGMRLCSGAMVNNAADDGRQLFLTANHCLYEPDDWVLLFNYQSSTCGPPSKDGPTSDSVQGMKLLANAYYSDFALLEVTEKIPSKYGVYLAGWDARGGPVRQPTGISHPSGDVKKFTQADEDAEKSSYFVEGDSHWHVGIWSVGTTEPGSSGSPLFDGADHKIVGQLHGGEASCSFNYNDYYGALWQSWGHEEGAAASAKSWLSPDGNVKTVDGREL